MNLDDSNKLTPAQSRAFQWVMTGFQVGNVVTLSGGVGRGKTTILRQVHAQKGGSFLSTREFVEASAAHHPLALEESFYEVVLQALKAQDVVLVDDFHLVDLSSGCHFYPRSGYLKGPAKALCAYAHENKKKLVFSAAGNLVEAIRQRSYSFGIERFKAEDYRRLIENGIGTRKSQDLDVEKIFRFAPKLNAHQLIAACKWMDQHPSFDTNNFIEYLKSQRLASNVDLEEVQTVNLRDLKGVDEVLRDLEINIVLPLQNDTLANELKLRSKRGVLLYGPPGTGKTTVGRALAHRLKGKFFLIDGTFITGTNDFYQRVQQVFEAAKENAPAVIFIDDADAIFEDGEERGLYRYLLTMLDGLESESAGRVCVMMTAMNVGHLPPALVRSGRVELWLEMKLPDSAARASILDDQLASLPADLQEVKTAQLVAGTEGFTGADMKRLLEDAKAIYAYDRSQQKAQSAHEYFVQAIETVRRNKEHYAKAEAESNLRSRQGGSRRRPSFVPPRNTEETES